MMQIIPRWRVQWMYVGQDKWTMWYIHANNFMDASQWFCKLSHGKLDLLKVEFLLMIDENISNVTK